MLRFVAFAVVACTLAGCGGSSSTPPKPGPVVRADEAKEIADAMAKLSPEDRKLAEVQKNCAVSGEPLGSMGVPIKVTLKGDRFVFVCCSSCVKGAEKDPDAALKKAAGPKDAGK